jgi:hypothetical protein
MMSEVKSNYTKKCGKKRWSQGIRTEHPSKGTPAHLVILLESNIQGEILDAPKDKKAQNRTLAPLSPKPW